MWRRRHRPDRGTGPGGRVGQPRGRDGHQLFADRRAGSPGAGPGRHRAHLVVEHEPDPDRSGARGVGRRILPAHRAQRPGPGRCHGPVRVRAGL